MVPLLDSFFTLGKYRYKHRYPDSAVCRYFWLKFGASVTRYPFRHG